MQFALNSHLFGHDWPMTKYTTMHTLFMQLNVPKDPMNHYYDGYRWEMTNYMFEQVLKQTQTIIVGARFFSLSVDEVTTVDNQS